MKCPCCKYEHKDSVLGYVNIEKIIKSGSRKGQIKKVKEWGVIEQSIGDEDFEISRVISIPLYGVSCEVEFVICPKCGVVFKERRGH